MHHNGDEANRLARFLGGCCVVLAAILASLLAFLHRK